MNRPRTSAMLMAVFVAGLVGCGDSQVQTTGDAATERMADVDVVPAGAVLTFQLTEPLSASANQAGDSFDAVVADDVLSTDGHVLLHASTRARGVVVEARRGVGEAPSVLAVQIDDIRLNNEWVPIEGTSLAADVKHEPGDTGGETAGKIAVGTAAGALLGQILGKDTKSTLIGAGVGTVAGTIVALTSRKGDATLKDGARIRVRLDKSLPTG